MKSVAATINRSGATLLEDVVGAAALFVTLIASLHLPGIF